ncbi:hypothetical protein FHX06_005747 [Rhizobium sp. BK512]|nr:hypothetical protein [Rhizobium sp. BK512]
MTASNPTTDLLRFDIEALKLTPVSLHTLRQGLVVAPCEECDIPDVTKIYSHAVVHGHASFDSKRQMSMR